jgi:hypothetical protein
VLEPEADSEAERIQRGEQNHKAQPMQVCYTVKGELAALLHRGSPPSGETGCWLPKRRSFDSIAHCSRRLVFETQAQLLAGAG